jgi:uncharacterized phiE125 gp8 family phage protein
MTTFTQPAFWQTGARRPASHYALSLVAGQTITEPLVYAEVKIYPGLRLPDNTDELHITSLIKAARQKVETDTGLRLITQSWDLTLDAFPSDAIYVPLEPLLSATIKTTTTAGVESTLAPSNYQVDIASSPPRILLSDTGSWPSDLRAHAGIVIRLSVGFGATGASVPEPLREAMRIAIRCWYAPLSGAPYSLPPVWMGYDALIAPYRLVGVA